MLYSLIPTIYLNRKQRSSQTQYKDDDTWGNFFEQFWLGNFPLRMGNKFISG